MNRDGAARAPAASVRGVPSALVALAGALAPLPCVFTLAWPLAIVCVAVLVMQLDRARSTAHGAWLGLVFGTAWLVSAVWWLFISMHRYGHIPAPLAVLAVLALSLALAAYLALAAAAYVRWRHGTPLADVLLFTAWWLLAEWARARLFTGFPWAAIGYTQVDGPWAALAPWIGVYGIGALVGAAGAVLAVAWRGPSPERSVGRQSGHPGGDAGGNPGGSPGGLPAGHPRRRSRRRARMALAAVLAVSLGGPAVLGPPGFTTSTGTVGLSLVQTNVAQDEKFAAERMPDAMAWLAEAMARAPGPLVIAPETAIPLLPSQLADVAPGWWDALQRAFADRGRAALVGMPLGDYESGYTNSVMALDVARTRYRYDKQHLVPFGEFIPSGFRWFTDAMQIPLGDFARGPLDAPSYAFGGQRIAPNICYEDLFGEELAVRFRDVALAPTILANLSNIGWFGDTIALPQHLNISRMRTLEFQRPMVRATNTGVTAIIDHQGVVRQRLPVLQRGVLDGRVEGRSGNTPYARWVGRFGLWPLAGGAALLAALLALSAPHATSARGGRR